MLNRFDLHKVSNTCGHVLHCAIVDSHFNTLVIHDASFKAEHREHHQCGQHRREEVDEGDENSVKVAVVVALVVTGEGNDATETQAESEEHLCSSFSPHLRLQHDFQLTNTSTIILVSSTLVLALCRIR